MKNQRIGLSSLPRLITSWAAAVILVLASQAGGAQTARPIQAEFLNISNEFASIEGVLYSQRGTRKNVALIYTHPFANSNLRGPFCESMAARGFAALCINNRFTNNQQLNTIWEPIALDLAAAVKELRSRGYPRIVLVGYSAGGPTMGYYQNLAEHGNAIFRNGATLSGFRGFVTSTGAERRMPAADGLVFVNPSTGVGASGILRLDGSVINEETGERDPALNMYNTANGYNPTTGTAVYSPEFLRTYRAAQCTRMNRLIDSALARLAAVSAGTSRFVDDDIAINIGLRANPAYVDLSIGASTAGAWPVIPGGVTEIVRNDRRVANNRTANNSTPETARSDRSFIGYRGVRCIALDADATTAEAHGLDTTSNSNTLYANIAGASVPMIVFQGTADNTIVHLTLAELIYNSATGTSDRTLNYVRGMSHGLVPVSASFGDTVGILNSAIANWLNARFR
jgi:hypothetical protein